MARILTTGTLSGLGRHIHETLGGFGWTRQLPNEDREEIKRTGVDIIVHCAVNSRRPIDSESLYGYLADNVLLTKELVSIPHGQFVFISTVDVYSKQPGPRLESNVIELEAIGSLYSVTKLMSEAIVREHSVNHLILRCVSLLGEHSRRNSLTRIIEDEPCALTLTGDSQFNYVLHSDVSDFIEFATQHSIHGIYNVSCVGNVALSELADIFAKQVEFGAYRYDVGEIDNTKIASIFPAFTKTSKDVIAQFAHDRTRRSA